MRDGGTKLPSIKPSLPYLPWEPLSVDTLFGETLCSTDFIRLQLGPAPKVTHPGAPQSSCFALGNSQAKTWWMPKVNRILLDLRMENGMLQKCSPKLHESRFKKSWATTPKQQESWLEVWRAGKFTEIYCLCTLYIELASVRRVLNSWTWRNHETPKSHAWSELFSWAPTRSHPVPWYEPHLS